MTAKYAARKCQSAEEPEPQSNGPRNEMQKTESGTTVFQLRATVPFRQKLALAHCFKNLADVFRKSADEDVTDPANKSEKLPHTELIVEGLSQAMKREMTIYLYRLWRAG